MLGGEVNSYPIQLLVNYWELRPAQMGPRLDDLLRRGISHIATFVPWQAVESDISHTLSRFLLAVTERKMTLSLILTPEVGVHYQYSGLPKDIALKQENQALHAQKGPVTINLPPNTFRLPSLFSADFTKRYYAFLSRMDTLLSDFRKTHNKPLNDITVVLTGSYWKYYRSAADSSRDAFGGTTADFSPSAGIEFRQRVDYYFSQPEFSDPNPAAATRWKTRAMEDVNYRWFNAQSESVFRHRTMQMVRKKAVSAGIKEIELFTPEADPALAYTHFLQTVSGGHGDFFRLSEMVDQCAAFSSMGAATPASSFIHWSSLGGFRSLTDSEKQFLILKSLLMMGGVGGGLLIDEEEWFNLSPTFRMRAEAFARTIANGDLKLKTRALYLTPHLWSKPGPLWKELFNRLGAEARMVSSMDLLARDREASVVIVDPSYVLTHEVIQKLAAWAKSGRLVVLPRSSMFTEMARAEVEVLLNSTKRMDIDLGLRYRLHAVGDGKLIVHEMPAATLGAAEAQTAWQTFLTAVLSIADVATYCKLSDSRLATIPLARKGRGLGMFVLNGTRRQVSADLVFPDKVIVSDLAVTVSASQNAQEGPLSRPSTPPAAPSNRFALDVPPCGILPLSVSGMNLHTMLIEAQEKLAAAQLAQATRENALLAASSELPGMEGSAFVAEEPEAKETKPQMPASLEDLWS